MSVDCVLTRFARQGIPVIHLSDAKALARRYGLPEAPATLPAVSPAGVSSGRHNRWLAAAVLAAILLILRSFVLTGFGYRLTTWLRRCLGLRESASESPAPQWMV